MEHEKFQKPRSYKNCSTSEYGKHLENPSFYTRIYDWLAGIYYYIFRHS
jgi:hypothetical protein